MTKGSGQSPLRPMMAKPQFGDATAAIAVALLLIPQCLAYAELAGMPAHVGLIAASIPPIIVYRPTTIPDNKILLSLIHI